MKRKDESVGYIYCKILHKTIKISKDAEPDIAYGFICNCGRWTGESHNLHHGIFKGQKL